MPKYQIPQEWCFTTLGEVVELKYGKSLPATKRDGGLFPVYGSNGVVGNHSEPLVKTEGIIIGRKGSYGEIQLSHSPFFPIDTTYFVDDFYEQPLKYWSYQLKLLPLTELNRSTAIPGLNREDAYSQTIYLPPLAEQKVIADKLDTLLAQVETNKNRLECIPEILKTFRQSVLTAAMSGKLTDKWRKEKRLDAKADLASELRFTDRKKKKTEPTSFHDLVENMISSSWALSKFEDLYRFIDYRGKTPRKSKSGKRLYTAKNIKMGYLSDEPVEYISEQDYDSWMTRGKSKLNDIFFVTEGHTMGCVALNDIGSDIALAQRTLTLQPYGQLISKFHYYFMLTEQFQKVVDLNATGTAAKGIKAAKFRGLPVPFPAYDEQIEVVSRVDDLFGFADSIEQKANAALERVHKLTQSILAQAFRGELTAEWREANPELISGDNSAEALLERIKAERKAQKPLKKSSARRKS